MPLALADNTTYYWRARAYDGISYSDWMATARFFVNTTPEAPTVPVVSRPPHESEVTVLQPFLQVVNAADADGDTISYTFSVYADETLSTLVAGKTGVVQGSDGTSAWQVDLPLEDNTSYWWTVQAVDDEGLAGGWSAAGRIFRQHLQRSAQRPGRRQPGRRGRGGHDPAPACGRQRHGRRL